VPRELSDIVMHCLAKQPESRYPSAEALAEDLEAFLVANGGEELLHRSGTRSGPRPRIVPASGPSWHEQRRPWWQDRRVSRRSFISVGIAALAIVACGLAWWANRNRETHKDPPDDGGSAAAAAAPAGEPIRVGVLGSLSGALRITEEPVVDAIEMAIDELNAAGGLFGRQLEAIIADGASSPERYAEQVEKLAGHDHVPVIFSCGISACRKAMVPVIEAHDGLLFYATQSEGLEQSPNVVYTGAAPNQQILPAVKWCYASLDKRRYFLVGSDYVFPHAANAIMKDELAKLGGEVVGERYIPLSGRGIDDVVREIVATRPDVILNTINGEANIEFFAALREAGITPAEIPTFSFSISEQELRSMDLADMAGDYIAQTYFQSVESPENQAFLKRLWARYGRQRVATDSMESAYAGVMLWAKAAQAAGTVDPAAVRAELAKQHYAAPGGDLYLDPETLNTYKVARIGQIQPDGQLEIVYQSPRPLRPEPFPASRTRAEWEKYLEELHTAWGGNWHNPGK
jgi:urea transport system substrate-binding protein